MWVSSVAHLKPWLRLTGKTEYALQASPMGPQGRGPCDLSRWLCWQIPLEAGGEQTHLGLGGGKGTQKKGGGHEARAWPRPGWAGETLGPSILRGNAKLREMGLIEKQTCHTPRAGPFNRTVCKDGNVNRMQMKVEMWLV